MIITKIEQQKRKGRYNIFVDGEFFSGIDALSLVSSGLKEGIEVDKSYLSEKVFESETRSAFDKLARFLASPKSKKEATDRLRKYGYDERVIEAALLKAEEYGYLSDSELAKMVTSSRGLKSRREVKAALYKKGIDKTNIEEAVKAIDDSDELSSAMTLAEKYMKKKEINDRTISALYSYLLRKGFESSAVRKVLNKYKDGIDYDWN